MTDKQDSADTAREKGAAQPPNSEQVSGQPSVSLDADALLPLLNDPKVDEFLRRKYQSEQDRGINQAKTQVKEVKEEVARLAKLLNKTPEEVIEAQERIEQEDNLAWVAEQRRATRQQPLGNGVDLASARTSILQQTGLTEAPTGFDDFLADLDWNDPINATLKATAWVAEKKANTKQPSAATTPPPTGSAPSSTLAGMEVTELGDKLIELQRDPIKNKKAIKEIDDELRRRDG
jgi:hypothetical protein